MYNAFWLRVTDIMKASLFGRLFLAICEHIGGAFKSSWFYSFFANRDMGDFAQKSFIPNALRKLFFKGFLSDFISQSYFINCVCKLPEKAISAPVAVFSCYLIPSSLIMFLNSFNDVSRMILFSVIFIVGVILIRVKTTVGSFIGSSFVIGKLCDFFNIKTDYNPNEKPLKIYILAFICGVIAGASSFVGGTMIIFAAFFGLLLLPLLISSPLLLITLTVLGGISLSTFPAVALSILTFAVVICRVFCKIDQLPKLRPIYIFAGLYFALTVYHMFFGFAASDSMLAAMIQLSLMLLFFAITIVINNKENLKKLVFAISSCTLITSAIGLYQFIFGKGGLGWSDNEEYIGGLSRITATFANPNVYGEFLIISICISIVAVLIAKGWLSRLYFIGSLALQIVNLALTYSRGCYIAVILAVLIIVWCCDKRLLGFGIFAVPILPYVLPQNMIARLVSVGSYLKDTSVSYRMSIWKGAMKIINNHWFIGSGVGTAAFTAFYLDYMIPGVDAQHSHNWFMQITIEMGIVALVVMLLIFFYSIKDVSCTVKKAGTLECRLVLIPLISALVGIFIEGFVDHIFYNNIIYMMFWVVIALLVAGLNIYDSQRKGEQ